MEYYKQESQSNIKWVLAAVLAGLFVLDLWAVVSGLSARFDLSVMDAFYGARDDLMTIIVKGVTHAGDTITIASICVMLVVLPTRVRFGIPAACAAVGAGVVQYVIKHLVERPRPDEAMWLLPEDGYSFPSGHSNASFVFYLFLMVLLRRYFILGGSVRTARLITVALPLLVAVIGLSRLYIGVHYPTDVLGGWLLGGVLLIVFVTLYDNFYPEKNRISYAPPSWEYQRKRSPWRRPQNKHPVDELIKFPKNRSVWRRPGTTAKRRALEAEREERRRKRHPKDSQ